MKKEKNVLYSKKPQDFRVDGYYRFVPTWFSYDNRPEKISPLMFKFLSMLPSYRINPYNGYLIKKTKYTGPEDFSDFKYNPHEKTDWFLKKEFGFE